VCVRSDLAYALRCGVWQLCCMTLVVYVYVYKYVCTCVCVCVYQYLDVHEFISASSEFLVPTEAAAGLENSVEFIEK
jgi:hypothetical protein